VGKIVQNLFVKFKIFKYLKFNKKCFKKYIYTVIKIPNYFPKIYLKCFSELPSFRFKGCIAREIQKREVVREGKKKTSTDLDAQNNRPDMGV
jgi:hypothetical protein